MTSSLQAAQAAEPAERRGELRIGRPERWDRQQRRP